MAFWNSSQIISINDGVIPNDGTGDAIRDAFIKVNDNFGNISAQLGQSNQSWLSGSVQLQLDTNYLNASNLFVANTLGTNATITSNITAGNLITSSGIYNTGTTWLGGNINVSSNIVPTGTGINLGSAARPFANLYVQNTVSTNQISQSTDAGILKIHANAFIGDLQDTGILGNISSDYPGAGNVYTFFGHQYTTNNFIYKITDKDTTSGNNIVVGGVYGNVQFGSGLFSNTTTSTSTTTGALIVSGGAGVGGNVWVGGNAQVTGGNLTVSGNIISAGFQVLTTNTPGLNIYTGSTTAFNNQLTITAVAGSTSTATGAIVVSYGGMGIAGNVNAGGYITATGNVNGIGLTGQLYGAQNNITSLSVGSGAATISVGGAINAASLAATSLGVTNITATGALNFAGATISGLLSLGISGNLTAGNVIANQFTGSVQGTILQSAQTYITSVGTLTSLTVTGNTAHTSTVYAQGIYDNSNRVLSTTNGAGNLAISGTQVTLSATGPGAASVGSSTAIPVITTDAYGRVASTTTAAVVAPAGTLTGATLASGVTASSLTSVGTLTSLTVGSSGISTTGLVTAGNISTTSIYTNSYYFANGTAYSSTTIANSTAIGANVGSGGSVGLFLKPSGVTLGTYGSATQIPQIVIGSDGRLTSATNVSISTTLSTSGTSGTGTVALGSQTLAIAGGTDISTTASAQTVTINDTSTLATVTGRGASTSTALTMSGGITVPSITHSGTSGTGDIGGSGAAFGTVWATATSAKYADVAEIYSSDADYEPGTVVIFGGSNEITTTTRFADARVAGAISTNPAYLMNNEATGLPVALRGRIPVKVIGPVTKGDSLVTSGNAGFAISVGTDISLGQAVFAKAIETNTNDGEKIITAVIL